MNLPSHTYPVDLRMLHREVAEAAITAAQTTIGSHSQRAETRTAYVTLINLEAIKITANDELYDFVIEVSNDDFTTVEVAAMMSLGATEVRPGNAVDNAAGENRQMHWTTEVSGIPYKDWRLVLRTSGTAPSIAFSALSTTP